MKMSRQEFRKWLNTKPATDVVGVKNDCCACPLARFHVEASGGHEVTVSSDGAEYLIDRGSGNKSLPAWASLFAAEVDANEFVEVTARRALQILDEIRA